MSNTSASAETSRATATQSTHAQHASTASGPESPKLPSSTSAIAHGKVALAPASASVHRNGASTSRPLWANSVDDPQIDERDSIYATTYFHTDSPPSSRFRTPAESHVLTKQYNSGRNGAHPVAGTPRRTVTFESDPVDSPSPSTTPRSSFLQSAILQPSSRSTHAPLDDDSVPGKLPASLNRAKTVQMGNLDEHEDDTPQSPLGSPVRFSSSPPPPQFLDRDVNALEDAEEHERLRYRSWREGKADLKSSKTARRSQSRDESRVDHKIEAILPKLDPQAKSTRSRKSSQYMGLFKENADQTERVVSSDNKRSLSKDATVDATPSSASSSKTSDTNRRDKHGVPLHVDSYDASPSRSEAVGPASPTTADLHRQTLLSETVAAAALRHKSATVDLLADDGSRPATADSDSSTASSNLTMRDPSSSQRLPTTAEEDEESEKEHISSATYIPHRQVRPDTSPLLEATRRPKATRTQSDQVPKHIVDTTEDIQDSAVQSPQEVEISLKSQGKEQLWHGEINEGPDITESPPEYASSQDFEGASSASGFESLDDSAASTTEYDSDEEMAATSPTTPKAQPPRKAHKVHKAREPMSAVPLKPFRHQVGGHNTVFQFSRKTICKKMNNRENVFYEVVEKYHPELLDFMPRYIGVLNVTFSKASKRKRDDTTATKAAEEQPTTEGLETERDVQPRVVSHSQQSISVPQVIFEHNRHIIPDNLFRLPAAAMDSNYSAQSRGPRRLSHSRPLNPIESISRDSSPRPHMKTWGSTRVNRRLQEQVLREVFAPPLIHRHRHHTRHHLSTGELSTQSGLLGAASPLHAYQRSISDTQQLLPAAVFSEADSVDTSLIGAPLNLSRTAPDDEPEYLEQRSLNNVSSSKLASRAVRRRHSGSGLRRRPIDVVAGVRSGLEFHEEDGYGADQEDEVFAMDREDHLSAATGDLRSIASESRLADMPMLADSSIAPMALQRQPSEMSTLQAQADARVDMFILLEDLTARMEKPCVLDLKMGTRQYGVEADEQKQRSQRRKCQMTTSRQLGVRVCGMQVWNVKTNAYLFEDKYFGRDLKAGSEFQSALTRFFFDGLGYTSARRHIPVILDQLAKLECIVRDLPGYRLYASSLLIIYDRAAIEDISAENSSAPPSPPETTSPKLERAASDPPAIHSTTPTSRPRKVHQSCPIKIKIVDFANCVTKEDTSRLEHATIPPRDANGVDRGYLRGLRTLKVYFQRIWREVAGAEWTERGECEGMPGEVRRGVWNDAASAWDDAGDVSV